MRWSDNTPRLSVEKATRTTMTRSCREVTALGLAGVAAFQCALAGGAPWGRASFGGQHSGTLPPNLRAVSAGAAVVNTTLALAISAWRARDAETTHSTGANSQKLT